MEPLVIELSLTQQFELQRMKRESVNLTRDEAVDIALQSAELIMLKDNIIRQLMKQRGMGESMGIAFTMPDGELG